MDLLTDDFLNLLQMLADVRTAVWVLVAVTATGWGLTLAGLLVALRRGSLRARVERLERRDRERR